MNLSAETAEIGIDGNGQPVSINLPRPLLVGVREPTEERELNSKGFGKSETGDDFRALFHLVQDTESLIALLPPSVRKADITLPQARTATHGRPSRRGTFDGDVSLTYHGPTPEIHAKLLLKSGNPIYATGTALIMTKTIGQDDLQLLPASMNE